MVANEDAFSPQDIAEKLYRYDNIAVPNVSTLEELSEDHVGLFKEQGYIVVEQVLTDEEIRISTEALMDIMFGRSTGSRVQIVKPEHEISTPEQREFAVRKIYDFVDHEPRLQQIACKESILKAMAKLLGEHPKLVQDQALLKPPFGGGEKPWHQDMAYGALAFERQVIGIWIALDEAGIDNGCMHVIPSSHREGGVPHYAVRDWQLCDESVNVAGDVVVPLKPGGALIFYGLLHHGTPPNFSEKRRRALQLHYAPDSAKKLTPREYKRMFTNTMTSAQC